MTTLEERPGGDTDDSGAQDLEIKDAHLIFNTLWPELEQKIRRENLSFPKEIFWLNGAPGSGKGTHTRFIMQYRDFSSEPIVVSQLINSPEARKLMDKGLLVGDRDVTRLVFMELLNPKYVNGAIVDGYPRTKVQTECLKLFYAKIEELHSEATAKGFSVNKCRFHIVVLFVDENQSIYRQLKRGQKAMHYNENIKRSGVGTPREIRATDLNEEAARKRYLIFKNQTYESLQSLRRYFHYHYINTHGSIEEVQRRILRELKYQSSLELEQKTYDRLSKVTLANKVNVHARQELIRRLEQYEHHHEDIFSRVVDLIQEDFMPIIKLHGFSGMAMVHSEDPLFKQEIVLKMLIDVLAERGYQTTVDIRKYAIPEHIDPQTHKIESRVQVIYCFRICFPRSEIRRGN